jgi:hypothetical protein
MQQEQIDLFKDLETRLHKKEVRNSREQVGTLLADDFMEFGKSGRVYHKQDTLDGLEREQIDLEIEVADFNTKELATEVVLVTYTAQMLDTDNMTKVSTNRSSIWIRRDDRWQMVFHQGTKIQS